MKTFTPREVNDLEQSAFMAGMTVERKRYEEMLSNKIMMTQLDFAGYIEEAKKETEERIIKLLEDDAISWSPDCSLPIEKNHCQSCWNYGDLIARIKGKTE